MAHVAIKAHILSRFFFVFFFTSFQFMTIHHINAKVVLRGCKSAARDDEFSKVDGNGISDKVNSSRFYAIDFIW